MNEQLLDLISKCRGHFRECISIYTLATECGKDPYKALSKMREHEKAVSDLLAKMSDIINQ